MLAILGKGMIDCRKKPYLYLLIALAVYGGTYGLLRLTKLAVRREWLIIEEMGGRTCRETSGTDVGHGTFFDKNFKPRPNPIGILFYPCWQLELRCRGVYHYESSVQSYYHLDANPIGDGK